MTTPTPALTVFDDPARKAHELLLLHRAWSNAGTVPEGVRASVARAWLRQQARTTRAAGGPLPDDQVRHRREESATLAGVVPMLQEALLDLASEAANELVICDAEGIVLWMNGPGPVRRRSEALGFVEGACWTESSVGSNALGTALEDNTPVQIFGPEHSREDQHSWVCTGAPIRNPRTGRPLGALTLSGPLRSAHPHTLALVTQAVRAAEARLAEEHRDALQRLASAAPAEGQAKYVVVDPAGWVARAEGFATERQLWVPSGLREGPLWVPGLGEVHASPTPGGWVLVPTEGQNVMRLDRARGVAVVSGGGADEQIALTPSHLRLLLALADAPEGLDARALADRWRGPDTSLVTVRAEMSRLRRRLGGLLASRPYRLTVPVTVVG